MNVQNYIRIVRMLKALIILLLVITLLMMFTDSAMLSLALLATFLGELAYILYRRKYIQGVRNQILERCNPQKELSHYLCKVERLLGNEEAAEIHRNYVMTHGGSLYYRDKIDDLL